MALRRWGLDRMLLALNEKLNNLTNAKSKLILLIGPPGSGKTRLLRALGADRKLPVIQLGVVLGQHLSQLPSPRRPAAAVEQMRDIAASHANDDLVLLDNIELLFDRSLQFDPLDLLKRQAHVRRVVAAWPGELVGGRLTYADAGHPEYQDYGVYGLVPFELNQG